MITIKCDLDNINQEKYDEIINNLDFNKLICPKCNHSDLIIHGYYSRRLKTKIGTIYLRIIRVICKTCGSTHALLLSCLVPYSSVDLKSHIRIINNDDINGLMEEISDIDESNIAYVLRMFNRYFKERLLSVNISVTDDNLVFNCFKYFKRQFMQIKCTSNILFA